jgi:hypothetical protein
MPVATPGERWTSDAGEFSGEFYGHARRSAMKIRFDA